LKRTAVFPVVGDNDVADGKGVYDTYFPPLKNGCHRFEWGGIQFYALHVWGARGGQDRSEFDETSQQYRWFVRELEKPESKQAPFRIVFMHDPVKISRGRSSQILERVWAPAFEKYNIDVAFASWHLYERSHDQGVNYIISGGAGAEIIWLNADPAYPSQAEADVHHFCKVDVSPGAMNIQAIAIDGTVLDGITLTPQNHSRKSDNDIALTAKRLQKEIVISPGENLPQLPIWLFSTDCDFCKRILRRLLPQLAETHQVSFNVHYFDLALETSYDLFLNAGAEFGRQDADLPAIFIGDSVLGGKSEITGRLPTEIRKFLRNPVEYQNRTIVPFQQTLDTGRLGENTFNALTIGLVLGAGLLDGLNPCAFTTIVFLISYLTLLGASERKIVYTGGLFSLSVFGTYLLIGLFFHRSISWMVDHEGLSRAVHVALLVIVVALAAFALIDFLNALSGRTSRFSLRLPQTLRQNIENRIRIFADNQAALTLATIALGVVISGMELSCTGQVYIPIIAMLAEPQYRITAFSYLVLYNIAFIAPLVTVFILAFFGKVSAKWNRTRSYQIYIKLGYVIFFGAMIVIMTANGL
jgi:cytochrome c biogenesis protein CcdA